MSTARLPGAELVEVGLRDLKANELSHEALAVLAAAPRLRRSGLEIPVGADEVGASQRLYLSLAEELGDRAHGRHHAIMRRVVSYASASARSRNR